MAEPQHVAELIDRLGLQPHVEGGYYVRTFESELVAGRADQAERPACTSIYYLLTREHPIGRLHRNRSEILHFWHAGGTLRYRCVDSTGKLTRHMLGAGNFQLVVPGHTWKATELVQGDFALISEVVCPGFQWDEMELASLDDLRCQPPANIDELIAFVDVTATQT